MFNQPKKVARRVKAKVLSLSRMDVVLCNPKRCLHCLKPIRRGEAWTKQTPPNRAYSIIAHDRCNGKG